MNKMIDILIIGSGPAGLTAAYELLNKTNIHPIVYEQSDAIGGISQTVCYKGNRMDIGGHRFFSKDERVMQLFKFLNSIVAPGTHRVLGRKCTEASLHGCRRRHTG